MSALLLAALAATSLALPQASAPAYDEVVIEARDRGCDSGEPDCSWVEIRYPRFEATGDPAATRRLRSAVDELLLAPAVGEETSLSAERLATDFMDEYHAFAAEGFGGPAAWWLSRRIEVAWSGPAALTLRLAEGSYVGGAHPNHFEILQVVTHEGRPVALDDILVAEARPALVALGERAFRAHHGLPPGSPLDEHGFWFEEGRFTLNDNWGATAEGLIFHYNPYEVAAYAVGATEILLPWSEVESLLSANAPVGPR